ncbi:MAG: hypothetical protein SynsKO_40240 [Synoicihabitans sp.]
MISIAPFRFDVTPPLGHALLGGLVPSAGAIDDQLEAIGYVLLSNEAPIVVCVLDWAGLMNSAHHKFRTALATAAGTTPDRVALHCVHQHNAPFVCEETRIRLAQLPGLPPVFDPGFFQVCLQRGQEAIRAALAQSTPVTHIGHGSAPVHHVASNRRMHRNSHGRVLAMRGSSCTDPELIDQPEGEIDPDLQTIAFFSGAKKIVSAYTYATHPMSFYRDGRVTSDFCGLARKQRQREDPQCTYLYFTGCAGNIAAGKYNDGTPAAREELTRRMHAAMIRSDSDLSPEPLDNVAWLQTPLPTSSRSVPTVEELGSTVSGPEADWVGQILRAYWESWHDRVRNHGTLDLSCLRLNDISILHLPGEPFIDFQLHARGLRPDKPVITIGYSDGGPWYIPTAGEYSNSGYEIAVAFSEPTFATALFAGIERLLDPTSG